MPALALVDIVPIVIALVALALLFASGLVQDAVKGIADYIGLVNWPLVGRSLYNGILAIGRWINSAETWLWQHANPVAIVTATIHWTVSTLGSLTGSLVWDVYSTIYRVIHVTIPNAATIVNTVAHTLFNEATAAAHDALVTAEGYAHTLYDDGVAFTRAQIAVVDGSLTAAFDDIAALRTAITAAVGAAVLGLTQSVHGWIADAVNTTENWVTGQIGDAVQGVEQDIHTAVNDLSHVLSPEIAAAATAAAAAAAAFNAWKNECGDPLCNNLSGFGNTISQILGLISDGAIVALLVEAVANPQGVVSFIEQDVVDPVENAIGEAASLLGFRTAA